MAENTEHVLCAYRLKVSILDTVQMDRRLCLHDNEKSLINLIILAGIAQKTTCSGSYLFIDDFTSIMHVFTTKLLSLPLQDWQLVFVLVHWLVDLTSLLSFAFHFSLPSMTDSDIAQATIQTQSIQTIEKMHYFSA